MAEKTGNTEELDDKSKTGGEEKDPVKLAEAKQALAEAQGKEPDEEVVEGKDGQKRIRIPKSRHDAMVKAERDKAMKAAKELEDTKKRLQQLEALRKEDDDGGEKDPAEQVRAFKAKINEYKDQYEDLLSEGKKVEARQLRARIDVMTDQLNEYQIAVQGELARQRASDDVLYRQGLSAAEKKFPALNPDHDDFDEELANDVFEVMDGLVRRGASRADALARAISFVLRPDVKDDPAGDERARKAREKNADAQKRQPASLRDVGEDTDKAGDKSGGLDVMKLTPAQFDKLSEETKARLRGDVA